MSVSNGWLACALVAACLPAVHAAPDARHGQQVYARCLACHALGYDRVGPRHCSLLGRRAGAVPGFAYSQAMKDSRIVWDEHTLDLFLAHPLKTVPGSSMTYAGVPDRQDRADLISYLSQTDTTPECRALKPARP